LNQGGGEITEIPSLGVEKPITEDVGRQDRQLGRSDCDPGARRDTAGQTETQEIRQTDRETQITASCEEAGRGSHPTLDLDGEVEMQGEGKRGAGYQPLPSLENTGEPTQPTLPPSSGVVPAYNPENEIDMQEGTGVVKRGQAEPEENSHNEKWRKREGIKRRLQDEPTQPILPQSSSTMPVYHPENKIYMHEGAGGVKRGQTELINLHHDKGRK